MKIALIIRKLNVKGGTQRQALSLGRELKKRGHEVEIYTAAYDPDKCYPELLKEFQVFSLPQKTQRGSFSFFGNLREETRIAKKLAQSMDRDFDILNPHDQVAYKVAHYYKKYIRKVPSVWNMNDVPSLRWGYDKMRGVDENFHQPFYKRLLYIIFDWYDTFRFIRSQNAIVVVDDFNRGLVKKYLGREAITVRNGPDLEHFAYQKRNPPGKNTQILTSGILLPHRRFEDAISAVGILAKKGYNPTLSIIGDYDNDPVYYKKLISFVREQNLENRVTFLGRVSEEELIHAYHNHDIYTFQHHLQSDGLSPFEAAACGLPIIVSRTAGCHEVLTDRENALLVHPKNPEDLAARIQELADDPDFYIHLSEAGAKFVRGHFSWERYAENILKVFIQSIEVSLQ